MHNPFCPHRTAPRCSCTSLDARTRSYPQGLSKAPALEKHKDGSAVLEREFQRAAALMMATITGYRDGQAMALRLGVPRLLWKVSGTEPSPPIAPERPRKVAIRVLDWQRSSLGRGPAGERTSLVRGGNPFTPGIMSGAGIVGSIVAMAKSGVAHPRPVAPGMEDESGDFPRGAPHAKVNRTLRCSDEPCRLAHLPELCSLPPNNTTRSCPALLKIAPPPGPSGSGRVSSLEPRPTSNARHGRVSPPRRRRSSRRARVSGAARVP